MQETKNRSELPQPTANTINNDKTINIFSKIRKKARTSALLPLLLNMGLYGLASTIMQRKAYGLERRKYNYLYLQTT